MRRLVCAGGLMVAFGVVAGCETSSRKSVRYYEYDSRPHPTKLTPPKEQLRERSGDDWEMVAPGKMVSPGEMVVDPSHDRG